MSNQEDIYYLLIDEVYIPVTEEDYVNLNPFLKDFIYSYEQNQDKPIDEWLYEKMHLELPEKTPEEVHEMVTEIIDSVQTFEDNKKSLNEYRTKGRSKESWFASLVKKATSRMSVEQTIKTLQDLDNGVKSANEALTRTILTQTGNVSQNPHLNGFIAEQEHAQSLNLNAITNGSKYRAKVPEPNGKRFARNSVDLVIVDDMGKVVRRYQVKYCKDANATQRAFESGDYRGQRKLVPEGQADKMTVKASEYLEAPDGTRSTPLSKERALEMQEEARSGKWNDKNWNDYKTKDIARGIGKQAGQAALLGAAIGAGTEIIEKLCKREKIDGKEVAKKAILGGADFGVKAALTGAIKTGAEKGIIKCIPKGTPAGAIANVVFVGVENAKILYKYGNGEITGREALAKMEETTVSAAGGMLAMGYGAAKGATIGLAVGGPVGAAIGGFIGCTVAYMAGSAIGKAVVIARRKITSAAIKVAKTVINVVKSVASAAVSICRGIVSALTSW